MTTTPADEIAAVEAALMYYTDSTYVTDWGMQEEAEDGDMARAGRTAFVAIVSRLRALEAFVGELAAYKSATWESEYHCGLDMARDEIADRAAALLAASEESKSPGN